MPVFQLSDEIIFPHPSLANDEGLLAIGGDLQPKRLLLAYSIGVFPWYSETDPLLWWSPNPRMVLFPSKFKRSKSLMQTIRSKKFMVRFDQNFEEIINQCKSIKRQHEDGTWITAEMVQAYTELYKQGYAHSVEIYHENLLVGGLYGISLGKAFFGESMFHTMPDASKVALFHLVEKVRNWGFHFIDAQVETQHLKSLGAINISRESYLKLLENSNQFPTVKGNWNT